MTDNQSSPLTSSTPPIPPAPDPSPIQPPPDILESPSTPTPPVPPPNLPQSPTSPEEPINPPPPSPELSPEPTAVLNESSYGTPPSPQELKTAEQKAAALVPPHPKSSLKNTVKIIGGVLALVLFVGGISAGTGLVQIPGSGETRSPASAGDGKCEGTANGTTQCNTGSCRSYTCVDGEWERASQDVCPQPCTPNNEEPSGNQCPNGAGTIDSCVSYNCPDGDPDDDGQCKGSAIDSRSGKNCAKPACGQVDYYHNGSYCGHIFTGGFPECKGGGGGEGGGEPCTESETCPGNDANGKPVTCGPKEDCIVRDGQGEGTTLIWGCKQAKECKEQAGILCTGLDASQESPTIGETVDLTCKSKGSNKVDHFEFRYQIAKGSWVNLASGTAEEVDKKKKQYKGSSQLTVPSAGNYKVQCRVCKKPNGNCTNWGKKS